jgi:small conductance mechanosensitive channel
MRVVVTLALAWFFSKLAKRFLLRLRGVAMRSMDRHGDLTDLDLEKRAATIGSVLFNIARWIIWVVALLMALNELSFDTKPLIAGLGVAGLALSLGAQNLIKDWLGGMFLLLEDQLRIGDSVTINGIGGSVEEINLRTTVLRSENGAVNVIPNGSIVSLANMSRDYSYFIFETTIALKADAGKALEILAEVGDEVARDPRFSPDVLSEMELYGVDRLEDQGAVIKGKMKTLPNRQAALGREINRLVLQRFDKEGVAFPPPK